MKHLFASTLLVLASLSCRSSPPAPSAGASAPAVKTITSLAPPTSAPPPGAVVLFDGTNTDAFVHPNGSPLRWKIRANERSMECDPATASALTRRGFEDCRLHVEFLCPGVPETHPGQGKGNSGVILQNAYEVQILESFGREPESHLCGAIYSIKKPDTNAEKPAGQWQTLDVDYAAPRWQPDGKYKARNAFMTVWLNGQLIHKDVEVPCPTADHTQRDPAGPAPLQLQNHGVPVRFRNVWILPTKRD